MSERARQAWAGSDRRAELPDNWSALRKEVIARDVTCRWRFKTGHVCGKPGNQVDHVTRGDDHSPENLQLLCETHHRIKSAREGNAAARDYRKPRARPDDVHPALR